MIDKFIVNTIINIFFVVSSLYGENPLASYLLPDDHPMTAKLDQIFQTSDRVILNAKSLKQAGFKIVVD